MDRRRTALTATLLAIVSSLLIFSNFSSAQTTQPSGEGAPKTVGAATVVLVRGNITAVDTAKKLVTLEMSNGRKVTLTVDNPYNLQAAKVGTPVYARFYEVVTVRKKTPGESVATASLKQGLVTAQPGEAPGATAGAQLNFVVTVVGIDEAQGTVTVRSSDGSTETVKARDPNNLKLIKPGDDLVVSVTQAIAISLDEKPPA